MDVDGCGLRFWQRWRSLCRIWQSQLCLWLVKSRLTRFWKLQLCLWFANNGKGAVVGPCFLPWPWQGHPQLPADKTALYLCKVPSGFHHEKYRTIVFCVVSEYTRLQIKPSYWTNMDSNSVSALSLPTHFDTLGNGSKGGDAQGVSYISANYKWSGFQNISEV